MSSEQNKQFPASLLAALIGLLLGPIPVVAGVLIANRIFYPFFVAAPLVMFLFNSLLKGGRDFRALVAAIVFSLASAYLGAVACQVAFYVVNDGVSVFRIPAITAMLLGVSGVLPASASAYVYPLVFTALGVVIAAELSRSPDGQRNAECRMQNAELENENPDEENENPDEENENPDEES